MVKLKILLIIAVIYHHLIVLYTFDQIIQHIEMFVKQLFSFDHNFNAQASPFFEYLENNQPLLSKNKYHLQQVPQYHFFRPNTPPY